MHVLVVEPQADLGTLIVKSLQSADVSADYAPNAQSAVHFADKNKPDVVVLELGLPDHNGLEFLYEFRSHSDWQKVPIVIYSHIPREDMGLDVKKSKQLGVAEYLYKPVSSLKRLQDAVLSSVPLMSVNDAR